MSAGLIALVVFLVIVILIGVVMLLTVGTPPTNRPNSTGMYGTRNPNDTPFISVDRKLRRRRVRRR